MNVTVVCDNPRHARGKVTVLETYERRSDGRWRIKGPIPLSIHSDTPRCRLCGAQTPPHVPGAVLDALAESGQHRINIAELQRLVESPQQ